MPVGCPFCGLGCDDLVLDTRDGRLVPTNTDCPKAVAGFGQAGVDRSAKIAGKSVEWSRAIEKAAGLIKASQRPLYGGLGADIDGVRAILELAEASHGIVDHMGGDASFAIYRVTQTSGGFYTSLAEMANRADLLVFFGTAVESWPRFFSKWVWRSKSLFTEGKAMPKVVFIGEKTPDLDALPAAAKGKVEHIALSTNNLAQAAAILRHLWQGDDAALGLMAGVNISVWCRLIDLIKKAAYSAVIFEPGDWPAKDGDIGLRMLSEWVQEINATHRAGALPVTGSNNSVGAGQVGLWQSGYPLRVDYSSGIPHHDGWEWRAASLLEKSEVDLCIWTSAFQSSTPPTGDVRRIILGGYDDAFHDTADVFIPVGVPGIDHRGSVVRGDGTLAIPLSQQRHGGHPSVADTVAQLQGLLA